MCLIHLFNSISFSAGNCCVFFHKFTLLLVVTLSFFILYVSALESSTNLKLELKSWIFACCNISLKLKMFLSYRKTALALLILALMLASVPLIKDSTSSSELWAFLVQHWFHSLSSSWSSPYWCWGLLVKRCLQALQVFSCICCQLWDSSASFIHSVLWTSFLICWGNVPRVLISNSTGTFHSL